jgi:hypothetical protein
VNEDDQVVRNDLGGVIAAVPIGDCRLEFRHQQGTGDLWCVQIGPLATLAVPSIPAHVLAQVRSGRDATDRRASERSRAQYAKWQRVQMWLSGRRGGRVEYARHTDEGVR